MAQPGFGALTDRYRHLGWLIAAGLLVAGLGIGLSGRGDSYLITWLAVAASGLGVAAYHPEATRTARGLAGDSTQAMSWFSVGGNLGIALGPAVVTPILLATRLHGTPLLALPAVVMALVLAIRRPWRVAGGGSAARSGGAGLGGGGPASASGDAASAGGGAASAGGDAAPAGGGVALGGRADDWRGFGRLTVVVVLRSIAYFGVASLLALFAIRHFHASTGMGSAVLTVFVGSGVIGTLSGGWLADHWQRVGVLFLAAFVLGIVLFAPFAVQVTLGQDFLPNRIGVASGVTLGLAVSAGGVAAPLFGWLADTYGLSTALGTIVAFPAMACVLTLGLRDPRR